MRAGRAPYGSSRAWVVWAVRAHLLGPVRLVHAGRGIRVAHQLAAGGRRGTIERARDPAHAHAGLPPVGDADALVLAQIPRTDLLGNVHGGTIPVHRWLLVPAVRSCPSVAPHLAGAFGHAHRPRGLREVHAHLEMLDVPASPRRAAHISPRVAYSTPSNTHLSTWPSHQSARRCDDHWNPPFAIFLGGETGGGKCAMGVGCIVLADDAQVHSFGRWIVSANRGSMEQPSCDCLT